MFDSLAKKLTGLFDKFSKRGILTEADVEKSLREIRIALLEADIALPVVKSFIDAVREKAVGQEIVKSVSPAQMMVKIVHDQLVEALGTSDGSLNKGHPQIILLVGLQGTGKTTTAAKLGKYLKKQNKKVLMVSLDVYRPAAQEQLQQLGEQHDIECFPIGETDIESICSNALKYAKSGGFDSILLDTAGRLHINDELMNEVKKIQKITTPQETLLVVDSMTGQDAVNIAKSFKEAIDLTGIILTRVDGDARGGAALSMKQITGRNIKFVGMGEKIDQLEVFSPERIASRMLDMGDIVSLVEKASETADEEEAEKMMKKLEKGRFDLNDMVNYLKQMEKMGGLSSLLKMMPGFGRMESELNRSGIDDKLLKRQVAIIYSMNPKERRNYKILNGQRKKRIANGSGVHVSEVNRLLKQYEQICKMMKQLGMFGKLPFGKGALRNMLGF